MNEYYIYMNATMIIFLHNYVPFVPRQFIIAVSSYRFLTKELPY